MNTCRPGSRARSQRGQGTVEFQIISMLVLFPMLLGIIQMGLLMVAKNTLNVATLAAARAGAASGGDHAAMQNALDLGMVPLHASKAKSMSGVGMGDITSGNYPGVMLAAVGLSKATNFGFSTIAVLNPTAKAFTDFGVKNKLGTVIPVTNVYDNAAVGNFSRQTRADALLLKIEVRYCHEMEMPIIKEMILYVFYKNPLNLPPKEDMACYLLNRIPLRSQAVVRMTVAPILKTLNPPPG